MTTLATPAGMRACLQRIHAMTQIEGDDELAESIEALANIRGLTAELVDSWLRDMGPEE